MNKEKNLETILTISTALCVLFFVFGNKYFIYGAIVLGIIGLFIKPLSKQITFLWFKLAEGLGFISSKVLLSIVFYLILTPIAALSKIFAKKKAITKVGPSYYHSRNHEFKPADMENTW